MSRFPYITFGRTSVYDWSTGTESGTEQLFTLHVWSKSKGKKEMLEIMELARETLHDAALDLDGHRLVNLRLEFSEAQVRRPQRGASWAVAVSGGDGGGG